MKTKITTILFNVFLVTICIALSCQSQVDDRIKIRRISDRVVTYEYIDVNVTAVKSKNGIIIIDTHRSPATMNRIKRLVEKEFGRADFFYVINTHGDYDHSSGNQDFPKATIIGHENCPEAMRQTPANSSASIRYHETQIAEMKEKLARLKGDAGDKNLLRGGIETWNTMLESLKNEYIVTPPTKTFSDSLIIRLEDMTVKMIYSGRAHTDHDIFIYIPEEKLVFTGDLFTSSNSFGFSVNKMNDIQRIILSMNQILQDSSRVKYVIPGHGEYMSGKDFLGLRDLLMEKWEAFQGTFSAAKLLESMIETSGIAIALQKYPEAESMKKNKYYFQEEEFKILGRRFLRKGMMKEAIGVFRLSVKFFPNSALGYDNIGEAYLKQGDIDSAKANYQRSLQIFPANKNAREILEKIERKK